MLRLAGVDAEIALDPKRLRPSEHRRIYGDHSKITADTGWQPIRSIEDTLHSLLDYWAAHWRNQPVPAIPTPQQGTPA